MTACLKVQRGNLQKSRVNAGVLKIFGSISSIDLHAMIHGMDPFKDPYAVRQLNTRGIRTGQDYGVQLIICALELPEVSTGKFCCLFLTISFEAGADSSLISVRMSLNANVNRSRAHLTLKATPN